jgi:hypothetical protein
VIGPFKELVFGKAASNKTKKAAWNINTPFDIFYLFTQKKEEEEKEFSTQWFQILPLLFSQTLLGCDSL